MDVGDADKKECDEKKGDEETDGNADFGCSAEFVVGGMRVVVVVG